jgi:P-type Ca2+ transporter type 2C
METPAHKNHHMKFQGLTASQVEASRKSHGFNMLTPPVREPLWKLYLEKFDDPVIRILIIAAALAIAVGIADGKYAEGIGIIIAVILATSLGFLNEYKASKEFDILNQVNDEAPVKAIRDGAFVTVPKKDIVVGDIVLIEMGEEVPADGRVLEAVSLRLDESCLTGESGTVRKAPAESENEIRHGETVYSPHEVFRGTIVGEGHGVIEIVAVGDSTEIGSIAKPAAEESGKDTPLKAQLERLSKLIGVVGFLVAGLVFVALIGRGILTGELHLTASQWIVAGIIIGGLLVVLSRIWVPVAYDAAALLGFDLQRTGEDRGRSWTDWLLMPLLGTATLVVPLGLGWALGLLPASPTHWLPAEAAREFVQYFMVSVTIIVVAVPEGLPMSVTLSLAYSMRKMTAANNLVRKMHACETIGAATVICCDKTGTLTLNEMRVQATDFPCLVQNTEPPKSHGRSYADLLVAEAIAANSTANLTRIPGSEVQGLGNPTECALLLWLEASGIDYELPRTDFRIQSQLTFSTEHKYMGTLGISPIDDRRLLHVKGAPEIVLERCTTLLLAEGTQSMEGHKSRIRNDLESYQKRGMRTLAFAFREADGEGDDVGESAREMTWLGFVAIADPVRPEVPSAVESCREAGIAIKIVTGDNPWTTTEIARRIGLLPKSPADGRDHLSGRAFAALSDEEALQRVKDLKILSRARPLDKLRLVQLLQQRGEVVAVTGDGTNDAPALNYADVGMAMGKTGTSVAKEASDIILLDDSFLSIVNAVMWGRSLYENIQRFILFQLTINLAALGVAFLGPFIGVEFPLTVTQMLWVNLIMDTFAALALASEPPHGTVMKRPPRDPGEFIITRHMARRIILVGVIFLAFLVLFLVHMQRKGDVNEYNLSVFFTVFVMLQFWNLFNARCLGQNYSAFSGMSRNRAFLLIAGTILLGQILLVQFGGAVFRTVPLSFRDWLLIAGGTSIVLWVGEVGRWYDRRRSNCEGRQDSGETRPCEG